MNRTMIKKVLMAVAMVTTVLGVTISAFAVHPHR